MFRINLKNIIFSCLVILFPGISQASVQAVVITTEYRPGNWQPLPTDKIKQATSYSALQEISASKRFAFFQNKPKEIQTGQLQININLVEAAQTATVNISLSLPNQATLFSTHSTSLKNLYYDGIYRQFKLAGEIAGKNLITNYLKKMPSDEKAHTNKKIIHDLNSLNNRLTQINNMIVQQTSMINTIQNETSLKAVLKEFSKIDRVLAALEKQDTKLDTIISKVNKMNKKIDQTPNTQVNVNQKYILENAVTGQNTIPDAQKKGADENKAQTLYNRAQKQKRNSKYQEAEKILIKALGLRISTELKTLISDELFYNLPMFEAQAIAIKLGRNFREYSNQNKHKQMLNRIRSRYEFALDNNQNNFQRTRQIQEALDQHINTRRAMAAVLSVQSRSNFTMVHRQMEVQLNNDGRFPDRKGFEQILNYSRLQHKVISYSTKKNSYNAKLRTADGRVVEIQGDERNFKINE